MANFYKIDLEEFVLTIDENTGYFNATQLCLYFGKNLDDWKNISKPLIDYTLKTTMFPVGNQQFSYTINSECKNIIGEYFNIKILPFLRSWLLD